MSNKYELVVGLEIHAELSTNSKIYCSCRNKFGLEANSNCCPICTGMPGTLPTLNQKVVEYAVKMGLATNCKINKISKQDRKNYFYPDLPKAYQISQADIPICENGYLDVLLKSGKIKRIGIERIHIEEDAGKLLKMQSFDEALVDFNRCGIPLIEIVSKPDMRSLEEVKAYLETVKSYLIYLDISDAKMQEGSMRCDVNVSVRPVGQKALGTRCEMKNVNTFSGAIKAIEYEYRRQIEALEAGEQIRQETRKWDEKLSQTVSMRTKENSKDYRYFPEPDLKNISISQEEIEKISSQIPQMPNHKAIRYINELGLGQVDAQLIAENFEKARLFEKALEINKNINIKMLSNWILGIISEYVNKSHKNYSEIITPENLSRIIIYIQSGKISNSSGKKVFDKIISDNSRSVDEIILDLGLEQISNTDELEAVVKKILNSNKKIVDEYKKGKTNVLGYLVGQCIKETKGKGNPSIIRDIVTGNI